jgi:hypothetical protein
MKATGDCYRANAKLHTALTEELGVTSALLCHGTVTGTAGAAKGISFGHCWVELGGLVLDNSNGKEHAVPRELYYEVGNVRDVKRYTRLEAAREMVRTGHWGPWEDPN